MRTQSSTAVSVALALALGVGAQAVHAGEPVWQPRKKQLSKSSEERQEESKWDLTVGGGVGFQPKYEGSDEYEAVPLPMFRLEWNDLLFLSPGEGLGAKLEVYEGLEVSASVGYDGGRDEGDSSALRGLGDIDGAVAANFGVEYEVGFLTPFAEVTKHLGGTDGVEADFGVKAMVPLSGFSRGTRQGDEPNGPALEFGISAQWADDDYMEEYFGVSGVQSSRSGLSRFTAESGFKSVGAEVGLMVPFAKRWSFNAMLEYSRLLSDAADSPIVKDENQFSGGLFIGYKF